MQEICPKLNAEILSEELQKRPPTELMTVRVLVTVRGWQCSAAAEGRWGSLTKCGITKLVTVCRGYDGPSCRFVVKFREVIPVPRFQELKCFGMRPSTDRCAYDGPSYLPSRGMQIATKKLHKYGTTESMTVRRDRDDPS